MMGHQSGLQLKLFYHGFNLNQRVPQNHILRKVENSMDFDFVYNEAEETFGAKGNVSIPPPVILKMMILLISCDVPTPFLPHIFQAHNSIVKVFVATDIGQVRL